MVFLAAGLANDIKMIFKQFYLVNFILQKSKGSSYLVVSLFLNEMFVNILF
jgi:hypothetical protein